MTSTPAVSLRGVSKTFGATRALKDVSIDFHRGQIHAVVGQNGSGKSTLFKILSGFYHPDPGGHMEIGGEVVPLPISPADVDTFGFRFVHQDLGLAASMSILDNARLGLYETGRLGRIRWRRERAAVRRMLRAFDIDVDPERPVALLSQAERTMVAIARALEDRSRGEARLLVLDEPTAYLPPPDRRRLFEVMRQVAARGVAVAFATHRLPEVEQTCDRVTVLRDGAVVGDYRAAEVDRARLVRALIGRDLGEMYPESDSAVTGPVVLRVRDLSSEWVHDLCFDLRRGEILGLTGLVGMGQDHVPYLLTGAERARAGTVEVGGEVISTLTPAAALRAGIGLLPADRTGGSGILGATLRENLTLPCLGDFFRNGRVDRRRERSHVTRLLHEFDVRPGPDPELLLSALSGGNQQKALLAKWVTRDDLPVLILHEPTQGVDIGSRQSIFAVIRRCADEGKGVFVVSAEYEDLAHICDRVLIVVDGCLTAELSGADVTEERIIECCYQGSTVGGRGRR